MKKPKPPAPPQLFTATYLVNRSLSAPSNPSRVATAFLAERNATGDRAFPLDGADDPSFFCARHFNRAVTWGVCRTDVRNQVRPGDWVAFFAGERLSAQKNPDWDYWFVAALRVKRHHDGLRLPAQFKDYLNRLGTVVGDDLVQHEPALAARQWHNDWLWRLSARPYRRKTEVVKFGAAQHVGAADWAQLGVGASNYVEFDTDCEFVLARPPLVAQKRGSEPREQWIQTPEVLALQETIFEGRGDEHNLRNRNGQQPHRHTRRPLADVDAWFTRMTRITAPWR